MIGEVVGNYRIQRKLGEGGMGEVYEGVHTFIGRKAALKLLLPEHSRRRESSERFLVEARATASLEHPGIVEISDCGFHGDRLFIAMELLDGETLRAHLDRRRGGAPDPDFLISVAAQVGCVLALAHANGIVHRDLKPDNVFLLRIGGSPPRIKVLDFGIAKLVHADAATVGGVPKTKSGVLLGTPAYMSPEQCVGTGAVDGRSDIYSLGCILFEALCGRPPFEEQAFGAMMLAHLSSPVPDLAVQAPSASPALLELVRGCLAKDPSQRPQRMDDVVDALVALGAALPWGRDAGRAAKREPTTAEPGPNAGAPATAEARDPRGAAEAAKTFDTGAGEALPRRPPTQSSRSGALLLGAAGLVALALIFALRAGRAPGPPSVSAEAPSAPAAPAAITIALPGLPANATVRVDGTERAQPVRLPPDELSHRLDVAAPGHLPRTVSFEARHDQTLRLELEPAPEPPRAPAAQIRPRPVRPPKATPRPDSLFNDL